MIELSRPSGFIAELSYRDHMLLRRVVKQVHWQKGGWRRRKVLSDYEADRQIESWGPRVVEKRLRQAIEHQHYWGRD
jgi:hypothetical protein